jgi:hypothetical protein
MNLKTNQCPASKTNSPSPYPGTESFKLAPDNIISIIMDTGAVGIQCSQEDQADLCSKTTEKPSHVKGRGQIF